MWYEIRIYYLYTLHLVLGGKRKGEDGSRGEDGRMRR